MNIYTFHWGNGMCSTTECIPRSNELPF